MRERGKKRERDQKRERERRRTKKRGRKRDEGTLFDLDRRRLSLSLNPSFLFPRSFEQAGASDVVLGALDGYNGTVLAYGQTGSGKTHTMLGEFEKKRRNEGERSCSGSKNRVESKRRKSFEKNFGCSLTSTPKTHSLFLQFPLSRPGSEGAEGPERARDSPASAGAGEREDFVCDVSSFFFNTSRALRRP